MKCNIFLALCMVILIKKGTCLQCYVCGLPDEPECEASSNIEEGLLKTCNESDTYCYRGKTTIYWHQPRRWPSSSRVLTCMNKQIDSCVWHHGGTGYLQRLEYSASLCGSTCNTDGCNGAARLPAATTTVSATTSRFPGLTSSGYSKTTVSASTSRFDELTTLPTPSENSSSLCRRTGCSAPYAYCCNEKGYKIEYCCTFHEFQQIQSITTATVEILESSLKMQFTETAPSLHNWWLFVIPAAFVILILLLIVWRRKVQKENTNFTLEPRNSDALGDPDRLIPSAPSIPADVANASHGPAPSALYFPSPASAPPEYRSLTRPADPLMDLHVSMAVLQMLSNSIRQELNTVDPDNPPPYSPASFETSTEMGTDPPSVLLNEDSDDILPSYSSVMSGEFAVPQA